MECEIPKREKGLIVAFSMLENLSSFNFMIHPGTLSAFPLFIALFFNFEAEAQSQSARLKSDTTFAFMSMRFCYLSADSIIHKNKKHYPDDYYYLVYKLKGRYYLEKTIHCDEFTRADGRGHNHEFKTVQLDSFSLLDQPWEDIIMNEEKIRPFATTREDSNRVNLEYEIFASHDCIMKLVFNINGKKIEKEVPTFPLEKIFVFDSAERNIHLTYENINFSYNQNLKSVKYIRYIQELIRRLEKEGKFILLK